MDRSRISNGANASPKDANISDNYHGRSDSDTVDMRDIEHALVNMESNTTEQSLLTQEQVNALVQQEIKQATRILVQKNNTLQNKIDMYEQNKLASIKIQDTAYASRFKDITSAVRYHSEIRAKAIIDAQGDMIGTLTDLLSDTAAADIVMKAQCQASTLKSNLLVAKQSLRILKEEHDRVIEACTKKVGEAEATSASMMDALYEFNERVGIVEKGLEEKTRALHLAIKGAVKQSVAFSVERESFRSLSRSHREEVVDLEKIIETMQKKDVEIDRFVPRKKRKMGDGADNAITYQYHFLRLHPAQQISTATSPPSAVQRSLDKSGERRQRVRGARDEVQEEVPSLRQEGSLQAR